MRRQVAFYGSTPAYLPVLEVHGWGDLQPELYDCSKRGAWDDMAQLVDDEILDTLTIVTTPGLVAGEVARRYGGAGGSHQRRVVAQGVVAARRGGAPFAMNDVDGFVAPGFEQVAELLAQGTVVNVGGRERTANLGAGGGAFAAFVDGERVVDVWAGFARPQQRWAEDTRAVVMSATKGLTTLCAHLLYDRAQLDLDLPVVAYWPEFGAAGKEGTTVRQMLSHQSGAIGLPEPARILSWDGAGWDDTGAIAAALASAPSAWVSGSKHGYHGVTFGWLIGELVRRVSGKSLGTFFREEVARPLGLESDIGTPLERQSTVAQVIEWTRSSSTPEHPDRD